MSEEVKEKKELKPDAAVFWTGGFDSTCLTMRLLGGGNRVQPIYVRHSRSHTDVKGPHEDESRKAVRKAMPSGWKPFLLPEIVWDYEQFMLSREFRLLDEALGLVCFAANISNQYAAFQACRQWVNYDGPKIQMAVVMNDQLWWSLNSLDRTQAAWKFFNGFEFPLWWEGKSDMWRKADTRMRKLLQMTHSCEELKKGKTCTERGVELESRCAPCKGRLPLA